MGFGKGESASRPVERPDAPPPAPQGAPDSVEALAAFFERASGSLASLADVYGDRLRATTRETICRAAAGILVGIAAVLWVGSATLTAVRGLSGAIAELAGGRPWLGELAGGAIALALAAGAYALGMRMMNQRELKQLERKYAEANRPAAHAAGVPGASAGAGAAPPARGAADART